MMKKSKLIILVFFILTTLLTTKAFASDSIQIYVDKQLLELSTNPIIENGTTLVPMRSIFETLGLDVEWDKETQTATGVSEQTEIKLTVGNRTAYANGIEKELLLAPKIINGSTMVPLRFISEATGCEVNWIDETKTVEIYSMDDKNQLYVVPGEGSYDGYTMLKGYKDEDKFQVYFQGDANSVMTTIEDLRGINLDEIITWEYSGNYYRNSIKELYGLFSDSLKIKNKLDISEGEELSDKWFIDKFGKVYLDWATGMLYSSDASNLVTKYFKQTGQIDFDRDSLLNPDTVIEFENTDEEELEKDEEELQKRINDLLEGEGAVSH